MTWMPRATDTWTTREVPVLVAIAEALEAREPGERLPAADIQVDGLTGEDVRRSLLLLQEGEFVKLDERRGLVISVEKITPAGRRAASQWPSADDLLPRLVEALAHVADQTTDPEQQSRLRQVAATLGGLARSIAGEVGARMVEHQLGL
jgi:hypothetical protein